MSGRRNPFPHEGRAGASSAAAAAAAAAAVSTRSAGSKRPRGPPAPRAVPAAPAAPNDSWTRPSGEGGAPSSNPPPPFHPSALPLPAKKANTAAKAAHAVVTGGAVAPSPQLQALLAAAGAAPGSNYAAAAALYDAGLVPLRQGLDATFGGSGAQAWSGASGSAPPLPTTAHVRQLRRLLGSEPAHPAALKRPTEAQMAKRRELLAVAVGDGYLLSELAVGDLFNPGCILLLSGFPVHTGAGTKGFVCPLWGAIQPEWAASMRFTALELQQLRALGIPCVHWDILLQALVYNWWKLLHNGAITAALRARMAHMGRLLLDCGFPVILSEGALATCTLRLVGGAYEEVGAGLGMENRRVLRLADGTLVLSGFHPQNRLPSNSTLESATMVARAQDGLLLLLAEALGRDIPVDLGSQEGMTIMHGKAGWSIAETLLDTLIALRAIELLTRILLAFWEAPEAVRQTAAGPPALVTTEAQALAFMPRTRAARQAAEGMESGGVVVAALSNFGYAGGVTSGEAATAAAAFMRAMEPDLAKALEAQALEAWCAEQERRGAARGGGAGSGGAGSDEGGSILRSLPVHLHEAAIIALRRRSGACVGVACAGAFRAPFSRPHTAHTRTFHAHARARPYTLCTCSLRGVREPLQHARGL